MTTEIWYEVSTRGERYRALPAPDRLPRLGAPILCPVRPVKVARATDSTLVLANGRRKNRDSRGVTHEPAFDEALFTAETAIRRYLQEYERKVLERFAESMYSSILNGDAALQQAVVKSVSREIVVERSRFDGWREAVEAAVELRNERAK